MQGSGAHITRNIHLRSTLNKSPDLVYISLPAYEMKWTISKRTELIDIGDGIAKVRVIVQTCQHLCYSRTR